MPKTKSLYLLTCFLFCCFLWQNRSFAQSFTITPATIPACSPATITCTPNAPIPLVLSWQVNNQPVVLPGASPYTFLTVLTTGTYTIKMFYDNGGASAMVSQNITIFPSPSVTFTASDLAVCQGQTVSFSANPTGGTPNYTYTWATNSGSAVSNSNLQSIVDTFNVTSTINVTVIINDANGCQASQTQLLTVDPLPNATFTSSTPASCQPPQNITFTSASLPVGTTHTWDFGDLSPVLTTTTDPTTHTYNTVGSFVVTHIVTTAAGCSDTATGTTSFGLLPPIINGLTSNIMDSACVGTGVDLFWTPYPNTNTTISWNANVSGSVPVSPSTSTSPNPVFTYSTAGNYTITATMTDAAGCFSTQLINIKIHSLPVFDFYADDTFKCTSPLNTHFTIISVTPLQVGWTPSTITPATWPTFNASFTAPPASQTITATATDFNGCTSTVTKNNYITIQNAVADFTSNKGIPAEMCQGQSVTFDAGISSGAGTLTYNWTFTGGSPATSTLATPTVTYNTQGQYPVTLTVTDANGCTNTKTLTLGAKVGAHINPLSYYLTSGAVLCASQVVTFLNGTSPQPPGATAQWVVYNANSAFYGSGWNTGTVAVNGFGTFQTKLITNNNGCKDSISDPTVTINVQGPVALFGVSAISACKLPQQICFLDTANTGSGTKNWYVNNQLIGTGTAPCYTISAPGAYNFKLIIQGAQCTDSLKITVNATDVSADFTSDPVDICAGGLINFYPVINGLAYYWDFGDPANNGNQSPPYHIYNTPGDYPVKMYASGSGCIDTSGVTMIHVGGINTTTFATIQQGCTPLNVQFNNAIVSSFPTGTTVNTWSWDFGDGNSANTPNPLHTYTQSGSFQVVLYVTDANGCTTSDSLQTLIDVSQPIAAFSANYPINCTGNPITFTSSSQGFGTITYIWHFGTGTPQISNQSTINHQYTSNGTYTPTLIIEDILGCKDTLVLSNYINISPLDVSFTITGTTIDCPPLPSTFTATVNSAHNVPNNNFVWYYSGFAGYEGIGIGNPKQHNYLVPGNYSPVLVATSDAGCQDTVTQTNAIDVQGPTAAITFNPHQACPGENISLTAVGTAGVISYTWILPGSTPTNPTGANVNVSFPASMGGTYIQPYVLITDGNCPVTMPAYDSVYIFKPPVSNFVADDTVACLPSTIGFTATSTQGDAAITTYQWNFGETAGINATGATSTHAYNTAIGFYTPYLISTDANGCSDSLAKFEYIKIIENNQPLPVAMQAVSVTGDNQITVSFSAFNNVLGDFGQYVIERQTNGVGGFVPVGTVTTVNNPVFIDNSVNATSNTYCYQVKVENGCQNQSIASDIDCSVNVVASPLSGAIGLGWNGYTGWTQVQSYKIYKVNDYSTTSATLIGSVSGTTTNFIDSVTIRCSDPASYRIKAIQQGTGLEVWSDSVTSHPDLAGLSTLSHIKVATVESSKVKVQWDLPTNVSFLQGMRLEKRVNGVFIPLQNYLTTDVQEYIDSDVNVNTQTSTYSVIALDSCGNETQAGRVGETMVLTVLPAGSRLILSWTPYSQWKSGIAKYDIELLDINTQTWTNIGSVGAATTSFSDEEIRFAQPENCYRIVAVEKNGGNARSMSNESCGRLEPVVYVPTGFTPNGDGVNDFFIIKSIFISAYKIRIYDRWSKLIYESTDVTKGWDGTINGTLAPEGTYVYHLEIVGNAGDKKQKNGTVTIVR